MGWAAGGWVVFSSALTRATLLPRCSATRCSMSDAMEVGVLCELKKTSTFPVSGSAETERIPSHCTNRSSSSFLSDSERYNPSTWYLTLPGTAVCTACTTVSFLHLAVLAKVRSVPSHIVGQRCQMLFMDSERIWYRSRSCPWS